MDDMDDMDELEEQISDVLDGTIVDMEHASLLEKLTDLMSEIQDMAEYFYTGSAVRFLNQKSADEIKTFIAKVAALKTELEGFTEGD